MKRLSLLMLVAVVIIIAGCQAVAGVDLNRVLLNSLKVQTLESKGSFSFQLLRNEAADTNEELSDESAELMSLFSNITLQVDEAKQQDSTHMSMKGALKLGERSIGYSLIVDGQTALMTIEGAKRPFWIDMTGRTALDMYNYGLDLEDDGSAQTDSTSLTEIGYKLMDHVGGYLIDKMPNPTDLSVDPIVQETVNGETLSLAHVNVKLDAAQAWTWVKSYLTVLTSDRDGMRTMMKGFVDLVLADPVLRDAIAVDENGEVYEPTEEDIDTAVDEIIDELTSLNESMIEMEKEDDFSEVINKNSSVKADVYVDATLDIRKLSLEAQYKPDFSTIEDEEEMPFEGFVLRMDQERWNVNGDVVTEKLTKKQRLSAISLESLESKQGYETLRLFDPSSDAYWLLRNQFHIGKQTASWSVWSEDTPVIVTASGVTIVPLRDAANKLGLNLTVERDGIHLSDPATGTTIVVNKGSKQALVNGSKVTWSYPVTVVDNVAYVPARDFAKALGATVSWLSYDDIKYRFTMEREVG
ncbi:copper amine oxidase-like protein [Paenibacillus cellulosilyticus]|uniref:Copper amine oxidase-like protein n=1 Tax=Paenibacillus cellulosilyticus TaxID=375489 RepID=A0A2V2YGY5_9BACL|nr:copper amine oxidase N-terminal domain-containing protein [Paenibacillus cellulosilyticus]PWV92472.1 copper amine oxidase-like protein [Paenibacillus cellulosilyticus]QKS47045.1 copper amine oxidase N-terminal domain-containing protein [Paenibacillus cellulosilyticus]